MPLRHKKGLVEKLLYKNNKVGIVGGDMPPPARGCLPTGGGGHRKQTHLVVLI